MSPVERVSIRDPNPLHLLFGFGFWFGSTALALLLVYYAYYRIAALSCHYIPRAIRNPEARFHRRTRCSFGFVNFANYFVNPMSRSPHVLLPCACNIGITSNLQVIGV